MERFSVFKVQIIDNAYFYCLSDIKGMLDLKKPICSHCVRLFDRMASYFDEPSPVGG
jgi:hypothetical protein